MDGGQALRPFGRVVRRGAREPADDREQPALDLWREQQAGDVDGRCGRDLGGRGRTLGAPGGKHRRAPAGFGLRIRVARGGEPLRRQPGALGEREQRDVVFRRQQPQARRAGGADRRASDAGARADAGRSRSARHCRRPAPGTRGSTWSASSQAHVPGPVDRMGIGDRCASRVAREQVAPQRFARGSSDSPKRSMAHCRAVSSTARASPLFSVDLQARRPACCAASRPRPRAARRDRAPVRPCHAACAADRVRRVMSVRNSACSALRAAWPAASATPARRDGRRAGRRRAGECPRRAARCVRDGSCRQARRP